MKLRETAVLGPEDFQTRALPPDEGNGTGIIPGEKEYPDNPEEPENPEEDPYKVCFLRNNYYRLEGDFQNLTTEKYVLKVTVNPNWDADINLSLDKFSGSDGN